jgi:hypothetical protein
MKPLIPQQHRNLRRQRGALMAAALMMMVVAGIMLSAWVGLMSTRAQQVVFMDDALKRRQSLQNSKVIGHQLVVQRGFAANSAHGGIWDGVLTAADGGKWGGLASASGWSGNVFGSETDSDTSPTIYPFNASGLAAGEAFLSTRAMESSASMGDEQDAVASYGFMKMTCPPLRGDLFTVYKKPGSETRELDIHANTVTHFGGWMVQGRMVVKDIPSLFAPSTQNPLQLPARARSLYVPEERSNLLVLGTSLTGAQMPPSNLAGVPMTVGSVGGSDPDLWNDQLSVVRNDANPQNSIWHFMDREEAAGRGDVVTINSADYDYGAPNPPVWVEKQIEPPGPKDPAAAADETVGLTYPPPSWPSGYPRQWRVLFVDMSHDGLPHLRIEDGIDQIIFIGQAPLSASYNSAGLKKPVMVTITPPPAGQGVRDLRFEGANNRRWVLGVKSDLPHDLNLYWEGQTTSETIAGVPGSSAVHRWRCILVNEYRTVYANVARNRYVRFIGGVMTNWTFKRRKSVGSVQRNDTVQGLNFELDGVPDPAGAVGPKFTSLLPRDAWLETYFRLPDAAALMTP